MARVPERAKVKRRPSGGLTASTRRKSATIKPSKGHPSGRFPMPDKEHARLALADLPKALGLGAGQKAAIHARAERKLGKPTNGKSGAKHSLPPALRAYEFKKGKKR